MGALGRKFCRLFLTCLPGRVFALVAHLSHRLLGTLGSMIFACRSSPACLPLSPPCHWSLVAKATSGRMILHSSPTCLPPKLRVSWRATSRRLNCFSSVWGQRWYNSWILRQSGIPRSATQQQRSIHISGNTWHGQQARWTSGRQTSGKQVGDKRKWEHGAQVGNKLEPTRRFTGDHSETSRKQGITNGRHVATKTTGRQAGDKWETSGNK